MKSRYYAYVVWSGQGEKAEKLGVFSSQASAMQFMAEHPLVKQIYGNSVVCETKDIKLREASQLINDLRWAISNMHSPERCLPLWGTDACHHCDERITLYAHAHECKVMNTCKKDRSTNARRAKGEESEK